MFFLRILLFIMLLTGVVSCGLAGSGFGGSGFSAENSEDSDGDANDGEFRVKSGPLESEDTCIKNKDCVQLCDSMLSQFSDQTKCYEETEKAVQSFRDVYNLLALGVPRKLEKIDPSDMEEFLTFSPGLWKDAVFGFERGRKEDCTPNTGDEDPTLRENCKFEDYYQQLGYDYEGADSALQWIIENDWLAELINKYDEDQVILKALFTVLDDPTLAMNRIEEGDSYTQCSVTDVPRLSLPSNFNLREEDEDVYGILGVNCVSGGHYFNLAVQEENDQALMAGHELLRQLCRKATCTGERVTGGCTQPCINYFYCNISSTERTAILEYINDNRVINGFSLSVDDVATVCGS